MDDNGRSSDSVAVDEALAAFHDRLVGRDPPSSPTLEGLDADALAQVLKLQECLVRLERVRTDGAIDDPSSESGDGSTADAPRGSTFASRRNEQISPDASIGFSEVDDAGDETAAPGGEESRLVSAETSGPGHVGRFEILRVLGRGGQGLMLLAHDPVLARRVALKVPWSETLITPRLRRRFLREARAVARLTHPHIVAVYDVGEVGPICFIASALVEGPSLAAWLKQSGARIEPRTAAAMIADLADAMHYAHGQGVLHRDLKPGNLLLESRIATPRQDSDGQSPWVVKITDFGLAKILDHTGEETRSGSILGTPAYMSPEQARGEHGAIGPATDIYALGAILYELLTGGPPFRAASEAETLRLIVSEEPIAPRRWNSTCSPDLEAICLKCLEKELGRRYESASELMADLRRFLAGEPTRARPLSAHHKLVRWARRQPLVASLSLGILLLLFSVATVATIAAVRIDQSRREAEATAEREVAASNEATRLRQESEHNLRQVEGRDRQMWRSVYAANSRRAFEAYADGNFEVLRKALQDNLPGPGRVDLRGFEWYYLWRELNGADFVALPTGSPCYFVTYSPNGKLLLAGAEEGTVTVWDAATFALVHRWRAHESCVNDISFSPDGQLIATTSCDHTAKLWRTADWQPASEPMRRRDVIVRSAFTPDGKTLITAGNTRAVMGNIPAEITFWDTATAQPRQSIVAAPGAIRDMYLGLGGRRLVTINQHHTIQQWRLDGDAVTEVKHDLTPDVQNGPFSCASTVAPDGRTIVYTSARAGIEIADIEENTRRNWNRPGLEAACFAISHDGRYVAHGNWKGMVWVRELSEGSLVETMRFRGGLHDLCFSPDDKQLVVARQNGDVCVSMLRLPMRSGHQRLIPHVSHWGRQGTRISYQLDSSGSQFWHRTGPSLAKIDLATGEQSSIFTDCCPGHLNFWCIAPDGLTAVVTTTATGAEHYYLIRRDEDGAQGRIVAEFDSELIPQFDSTSSRLAGYTAGRVWIRDARNGQVAREIPAPVGAALPENEQSHVKGQMSWFAEGTSIIAPLYPECLRCDLDTGDWTRLGAGTDDALAVEAGPFVVKRTAVAATVVDGRTGGPACDLELEFWGGWDLSPDGTRLVAIANKQARLYDVATGHYLGAIFEADVPLEGARFSANGRALVLTSRARPNDQAIALSLFASGPEEVGQAP